MRKSQLFAAVAAVAWCALLGVSSAQAHCSPKGGVTIFAQCPISHTDQTTLGEAGPPNQTIALVGLFTLGAGSLWRKKQANKSALIFETGKTLFGRRTTEIIKFYLNTMLGSPSSLRMRYKRKPLGGQKSHGYPTIRTCRAGGQC